MPGWNSQQHRGATGMTPQERLRSLEIEQHYLRKDLDASREEIAAFRSAAWKLAAGIILTLGGLSLTLASVIGNGLLARIAP